MAVTLEDSLREIASTFESHLDELALDLEGREREEIEEIQGLDMPEVWAVNRRISRESRRAQAVAVRQGLRLPESCPEPDAQAAKLAVDLGLPPSVVHQAYRLGHALSTDAWIDAVDALSLPEAVRAECIRTVTHFANSYYDRIVALVLAEYERERARVSQSPEARRLVHLRDLVGGATDGVPDWDYDLQLDHVAAIGWGRDAKDALRELSTVLDRRLFWATFGEEVLIAWLGSRTPMDAESRRALRNFPPPGDSALAIGGPGFGLSGFRRSHRQAGEAHAVALRRPQPVTLYEDVMLEAFALRDERVAREFVESALGELGGEDQRSRGLRETLRAYFLTAQNAASAAARLGVHEQTVARRLRAAEEMIGASVNVRRAELELALRLDALFKASAAD